MGMIRKGNLTLDVARYLTNDQSGYSRECVDLPHELEFPIWWNEADCSGRIKFSQANTLMKVTVVQFNSVRDTSIIFVDDKFVIQSELAFWDARQICSHLYVTVNIGTKNGTCWRMNVRTCRREWDGKGGDFWRSY